MQNEQKRGKRALAAIVSSSTLISTGSKTGSEAKIRQQIFDMGIVKAVVEQPNAMFTNTDISSHIWFLDTEGSETIKVLKADNLEQPLCSPHPAPKDKMRNAYSEENIKTIVKYLNSKKDSEYVCKDVEVKDRFGINISHLIGSKPIVMDYDLDDLEQQIKDLFKQLVETDIDL